LDVLSFARPVRRPFASQTEKQEAEQVGKQVHPKQAKFHHGPIALDFACALQIADK
jgi:hypothetical protein